MVRNHCLITLATTLTPLLFSVILYIHIYIWYVYFPPVTSDVYIMFMYICIYTYTLYIYIRGGRRNRWTQNFYQLSVPWGMCTWVRSRNCGCLVTWFCYQLIAKPGNKPAAVSWPDPHDVKNAVFKYIFTNAMLRISCETALRWIL